MTICNGNTLPIVNHGKEIMHTLNCNIQLHNLLQLPNVAYNVLSIFHLIVDNDVNVSFDKHDYKIKNNQTN